MVWFVVCDIVHLNLVEDTLCFYVMTPDLVGLSESEKDWVFFHTLGIHLGWVLSTWDKEGRHLFLENGREVTMLDYWEEDPSEKPYVKLLDNTLYKENNNVKRDLFWK